MKAAGATLRGWGLRQRGRYAKLALMKRAAGSLADVARVRRIFQRLRGARGFDETELLKRAVFLSKSPDERCRLSLQAARSVLSSRRSAKRASSAS
jgi:hypothetical protein